MKPIFHIKTLHCKYGTIKYSLHGDVGPFSVISKNGSIYLSQSLDSSGPDQYSFRIHARDPNALCSAAAEVQIYVVHVNEHKPIMSAAKYHCRVNENERSVEVSPAIFSTDKDDGQAGKYI